MFSHTKTTSRERAFAPETRMPWFKKVVNQLLQYLEANLFPSSPERQRIVSQVNSFLPVIPVNGKEDAMNEMMIAASFHFEKNCFRFKHFFLPIH